jgi:hypothetical protein
MLLIRYGPVGFLTSSRSLIRCINVLTRPRPNASTTSLGLRAMFCFVALTTKLFCFQRSRTRPSSTCTPPFLHYFSTSALPFFLMYSLTDGLKTLCECIAKESRSLEDPAWELKEAQTADANRTGAAADARPQVRLRALPRAVIAGATDECCTMQSARCCCF